MSEISSEDCAVLGKFPNAPANSWSELLTEEDRAAYIRIHRTLQKIGAAGKEVSPDDFSSTTTSGFYEASGVRNQRPKDLWCAVINNGSEAFVGMPQIFMITSDKGIEFGFAASIHPSQFSNQRVKSKLRAVIPSLFHLFPAPDTTLTTQLSGQLIADPGWKYRERTRLAPGGQEFNSFSELVTNLRSKDGLERAAGSVSKYIGLAQMNDPNLNLEEEFKTAAKIFRPLMLAIGGQYKFGQDYVEMNDLLSKVGSKSSPEAIAKFDPSSIEDGREKILTAITKRQGQGAFRLSLLKAYDGQCAITGTCTTQTLEAAHIYPHKGESTNMVSNGLLLRADLHTLFDLGLIWFNDDFEIQVSDELDDDEYLSFDGQTLDLPDDPASHPSIEAIRWHRKNVASK